MIIVKEHLFRHVVGLTALFVAFVAAFFSVMGIGMLFSGASISAMVMATALECGKIVATSFLYRYWNKTQKFLRIYLVGSVILLMGITSLGSFGWLSSAYQASASQYEQVQRQTSSLEEQRKMLQSEKDMSKDRLGSLTQIRNDQEKRFNDTLNNPIISRSPTQLRQLQDQNASMIKQSDRDISDERSRYSKLTDEVMELDKKILSSKDTFDKSKDVVTFQFVADAIGWDLTKTVKWFIVVIIFVFDPLAICLLLGYNVIVFDDKEQEAKKIPEPIALIPEPTPTITPDPTPTPSNVIKISEGPRMKVQEPVLRESEKYHTPSR